jgi:hypothetical protein
MRKQKFLFIFLVIGGLLFTIAAASFFWHNSARPSAPVFPAETFASQPTPLLPRLNIASSPTPLPPVSAGYDAGSHHEIQRVPLQQAKAAFDARSAVFLDVRGASFYATAHIPGALNIPLADLETRLNELDPSQWIIPYCT